MFLSVKLSPARLLAFVCVVVCAILAHDAWRTAQAEPPIELATDFDRAAYLKDIGLEVDPQPVWTKQLSLTDRPDDALATYISVLEKQGYRPLDYAGEDLTMYCYRSTADPTVYGRVLLCKNELVGADKIHASPDAQISEPIASADAQTATLLSAFENLWSKFNIDTQSTDCNFVKGA